MIDLVELYVRYSRRHEPVVKGVTARLSGKHLLLGPNGAGKTTLFKAICGLVPISSGRVLIDGHDVKSLYGRPKLLAVNLSEVYRVFHLSAYDHLRLFADIMCGDLGLALNIAEDLGLSLELLRRRKPWELSAGQQKAFSTSLALASGAKHVLLDEPFEQLDPARKVRVVRHVEEYRGVLVLSTHETWVLNALSKWSVHFMIEGRVYGPLKAEELAHASLVRGEAEGAILRFKAAGGVYSLVPGACGEPLSKLVTLDRIYEVTLGG
ncbi:MAG: ABC transporter [Thermoprotei archaeon]|nr:MAG: ABC transporter [Thermoprotei archaeon]